MNDLKAIIPNPFAEKIGNTEFHVRDLLSKDTIKVWMLKELAKNFGIMNNLSAPEWIVWVKNYFANNETFNTLIGKEKLTIEEFDQVKDLMAQEFWNYIKNLQFKNGLDEVVSTNPKTKEFFVDVKNSSLLAFGKVKKGYTLTKKALWYVMAHKKTIALAWALVYWGISYYSYMNGSNELIQSIKPSTAQVRTVEGSQKELSIESGNDNRAISTIQAIAKTSDPELALSVGRSFVGSSKYKEFMTAITSLPYEQNLGFDVGWADWVKQVVRLQLAVKKYNLTHWGYIDAQVQNQTNEISTLKGYLANFSTSNNRDFEFTEGNIRFTIKKSEANGKLYLDLNNVK